MAEVTTGARCYLQPGAPPSSYAVAAVLEGEPGGWSKVTVGTLQRSFFIVPGLMIAGARGKQLWLGAVLGSVGITMMLFGLYAAQRRGLVAKWAQDRGVMDE